MARLENAEDMLKALARHLSYEGTLTRWEASFVIGCGVWIEKRGRDLTEKQRNAVRSVFVHVANRMAAC